MANTNYGVPAGEPAWDTQQVARYLQVSERHIRTLRAKDTSFPRPRMVGRRPRWCPGTVQRWVADGGSGGGSGRKGGNRVR